MEFNQKLQELRKQKNLTQEELAEQLFVSRTAVSKWESGRGYPNIDSLKEISAYFSVSIDDLLSGEKLILLAQKENTSNIQRICDLLMGIADLFALMLILLPLYPKPVEGYVYSVNLWLYTETAPYNRILYWILFLSLVAVGLWKILHTQLNPRKSSRMITTLSLSLSIAVIFYLVLAREAYAATLAIVLMLLKSLLIGWGFFPQK